MFDLIVNEKPGLLFVLATLLPLASFAVLLLVGGVRNFLRSTASLEEEPRPASKWPAYVATGAIALAFVCSLVGFFQFEADHHRLEEQREWKPLSTEKAKEKNAKGEPIIRASLEERQHQLAALAHELGHKATATDEQLKEAEDAHHEVERTIEAIEDRWRAQIDWAWVGEPVTFRFAGQDRKAFGNGQLLTLGFKIDSLAVLMFLMVTLIATLIHLFSIGYMSEELEPTVADHQVHTAEGHLHRRGRFGRFFMFLSLFCFSMLNLVLADNLFQVFVSWELVGICSYLLIGFYYERTSASNAANKAFITNRVGDAGFIIGLLILWTYVGTFNFDEIFHKLRAPQSDDLAGLHFAGQVVRAEVVAESPAQGTRRIRLDESGSEALLFPPYLPHFHAADLDPGSEFNVRANPKPNEYGSMPYWLLVLAGLGIFTGCVGKSAQFPLQVWLPDAMEGPTPVSALIHAATMVAAGVYLVGRCFPLFVEESRLVIAYTGAITLFVAATIAIVMTDIKKVLAYSTVSQLGYMMLALGVGGWVAGLFHLMTHAFFKALLFLCSGSVIHGCHHEQDMTKMGGLYPKMKITAITMLIGVLTIAGMPFFSGWYSKDAILAQAIGFAVAQPQHWLLAALPVVTAGITTFYMFRMWFLTFSGEPRDHHVHEHAHESPWTMTVPLVVLAFFSVTVAWGWPLWDAEASQLGQRIHHSQHHAVIAEFGRILHDPLWYGRNLPDVQVRVLAEQYHLHAEVLAFFAMGLGIIFSVLLYYVRVLDPDEAKEQFPTIHRFLWNKWYFDELYSAVVVRPALAVAGWCRTFDLRCIDGLIDFSGRATIWLAKWDGRFDNGVIDGLVNLLADSTYSLGAWLRNIQTGFIRSYVLFLVLAALAIFVALSYFVALAAATG